MTDNRPGDPEKPDLTKTEMRQANSRRMNLRVLIIGVVVVVIGFALAIWYNTTVTPETETTTPAGETLEDVAPGVPETDADIENGALPVPTDDAVVEGPAPEPVEEPAPAIEDADPAVDEPEAAPEEEPVTQ
ncbi:hypothetical protein [Pelagibacterium lentulum]|uniref:Uncharacterized protein n=1 Tax=Pelagibacterium lentulum TaxID=2029865 RepID=A0A916VWE0_9HYPH|nr:hypothetical protein [Pelagibacterium lentulum]GGA44799.1 hypothetical protein GCM10011499_13110 [Pelagibacterium lentulum]